MLDDSWFDDAVRRRPLRKPRPPRPYLKRNRPARLATEAEREETCGVCLDPLGATRPVLCVSGCSHIFHRDCVAPWLDLKRECPTCRTPERP